MLVPLAMVPVVPVSTLPPASLMRLTLVADVTLLKLLNWSAERTTTVNGTPAVGLAPPLIDVMSSFVAAAAVTVMVWLFEPNGAVALSDGDPAVYLPGIEAKFPGALASHWIPEDRALWRVER